MRYFAIGILAFFSIAGEEQPRRSIRANTPATGTIPCDDKNIPRYSAHSAATPPEMDGRLDEDIWKNAQRSSRFVDLVHGTPTLFDTRAAVLWDDEYLYVGYWIEEPNVTATLTERAHLYR